MSKRIEELSELRELEVVALEKIIEDSEEELLRQRFKASSRQLRETSELGRLKKRIARAKTVVKEASAAPVEASAGESE